MDARTHLDDDVGGERADEQAPACCDEEIEGDRSRRDRACDSSDSGPQGDEGGGVIEQRFAFEDRDDAPRQADTTRNRAGRNGVRRGNDGSQRQRDWPRDVRRKQMHGRTHRDGGDDDQGN